MLPFSFLFAADYMEGEYPVTLKRIKTYTGNSQSLRKNYE